MNGFLDSIWSGRFWIGEEFDTCPLRDAEPVRFHDAVQARGFLARLQGDVFAMQLLRKLLPFPSLGSSSMSDSQVIEQLAWALASGSIRICRARNVRTASGALSKRQALELAAPRPAPAKATGVFTVVLRTADGDPIPGAAYEATLASGEKRSGVLGADGSAKLTGVPPGPVEVRYPNLEDVSAKALAAAVRRAFDRQEYAPIYRLLQRSPAIVQAAIASYDRWFNDYTGAGLVQDLDHVFTDRDAQRVISGLLQRAGISFGVPLDHFDWQQQDGA